MSRRTRRNDRTVAKSNQNFAVAAPLEFSPDMPSKEQIARAHYDRRMTKRDPKKTSCNLKYAVECERCIEDPPEETPWIRHDRLQPLRGFTLDKVEFLEHEPDRYPRERIDSVKFDTIVNQLKRFAKELNTEEWMKTAVMIPLGAKTIDKLFRKAFNLNGRRYQLLLNDTSSTAFLAVESGENEQEQTTAEMVRALRLDRMHNDFEMISHPKWNYAALFQNGEEPRLINKANESPIAVIFDEPYVKKTIKQSAERFYQDLLEIPVRLTRSMTDPENRWLENHLQRFDFRDRKLRILHFYTVEDRNAAMTGGKVEYLDVLVCDGSYSMKEKLEQLHLYVEYDIVSKHIECLAVTIANETDKARAELAFSAHHLSINYFNEHGAADNEIKYDPNRKTIVLQYFPRHLDSFEAQDWFTRRIAKLNGIPIEKTAKFIQRLPDAYKSCAHSKRRNVADQIEQDLYKIGHLSQLFRPINEPWFETMQGAMGARYFLGVVKERPDVPWRVFRRNEGSLQKEEVFTVTFKSVAIGLQFIDHVLKRSYDQPIFACDTNDRQGPKLVPCYRISIGISRVARLALRRKIANLDFSLRKTFVCLMKNEDVIMETDEAWYYNARLFEEWKPKNDTGIIGVMGWNPDLIRLFFRRLRNLLEPLEFTSETQSDLFYGIGEKYAKSLTQKYEGRVVVDVDKYSQKIRLLGDFAEHAGKDLENYSKDKNSIVVKAELPVFFPHYNNRLRELLTPQKVTELGRALDVKLVANNRKEVLEFTGSIAAHEKLTLALGEISAEIFNWETRNRQGDIPNMDCPTCMSPIGIHLDFYRFECGHVLCRRCTNSHIRTRIDDGQMVIPCLDPDCQRVVSPKEIMHILFGDSARIRDFDDEKLQFLIHKTKDVIINSNANLKPCPSADCPGILQKEEGEMASDKKCSACKRPYCRLCLADMHEGRTCEDNERLQLPDESIKQWVVEAGDRVKRCPNCAMMVEKRAGCNHMECIQCHSHFCWVCLFSAPEAGAIYGHMTEVHGGHGGLYINPEDEDADLQQALHAQFAPDNAELQRQQRMLDAFFADDEELDPEEEDRRNRVFVEGLGLPHDAPIEDVRRAINRRFNENFAWRGDGPREEIENVPPHLAQRPPGLFLPGEQVPQDPPARIRRARVPVPEPEPEPARPVPAQRLARIPEAITQLDPEYYADQIRYEGLLEYINNSETQEEQDAKIAELMRQAPNADTH